MTIHVKGLACRGCLRFISTRQKPIIDDDIVIIVISKIIRELGSEVSMLHNANDTLDSDVIKIDSGITGMWAGRRTGKVWT